MEYLKGQTTRWILPDFLKRLLPRRFNRWKFQSKIVLPCLTITIFLNTLYGIYWGRFSVKRQKFIFSKPVAVYSVLVGLTFAVYYVWQVYEEFTSGRISSRDTIKIYCYMNVCICLLNYVTQWGITGSIIRFQNSVPLFRVSNALDMSMMIVWRAVLDAVLKMILCPLIVYVTLILYQNRAHPEMEWTSKTSVKTMLPLIISNQVNNCFFGGLVISNLMIAAINKRIRSIVREVNMMQTPLQMELQKPYYRMRRCCELADSLDKLVIKYVLTVSRSRGYLRFTDWSMVMSMVMNLIGITLGFYNEYLAIADYYINEEPFDLHQAIVQLVFLAVPFMELILVSRISSQMLQENKKTGDLLQRIDLQYADVRFRQVVNSFWLQVSTIEYKLMPLGLLELNSSLVNTIFAAVTGFLLILIQSDLTLRFSLK
ncbi:putative gustatory receptor 97a [Drosophila pseudoobscura]|uniref:Gustatory receptor n=1 Tax=Drosophila pseudoobscura pseudoobscura TaxID=46245 RepID=A0A6I8UNB4_DROPS|nr:putative gustatory receptor 97a [Drosophila pseudoobscura]